MTIDRNKFFIVGVTICCYFSLCAMTTHALALQQQHQPLQQQHQPLQQQSIKDDAKHQQDATGSFETPRLLSPRIDYNNEWRPVGRGDPLQNDPTYDYSPPALERVRYWAADNGDKDGNSDSATATSSGHKTQTHGKNEILLLGVSNERPRPHASMPHVQKNAKGELPLLQPKYSSIRRSYYAHQLPTHLMPPPPLQGMTGSGAPGMHGMIKPSANAIDYRHNMAVNSFNNAGSTSSSMAVNMKHTKPYYSTTATSPWSHMHSTAHSSHSSSPATTTSKVSVQHGAHGMPFGGMHDSQHQESAHYLSYTRPGMSHAVDIYSPNAIHSSHNVAKTAPARKPWLHELLQKELIKPARPTMPATKFLMGPVTKPSYDVISPHVSTYSTTYKPINYVSTPPTILPHRQTTLPPINYQSSPIYITTTSAPTTTTTTTTTTTPAPYYQSATRLLIPETSNLVFRPTVAPMEMTTDALFSHYNQPEKPLMGPMYLIIEGHSKVKTYGKDELDPHRPKIVPIIPKREPIVRIADPNEQRGSVATFQVKHLHTVTTPATTTTTTTTTKSPKTTKMVSKSTTSPKTATATTTPKPTTTKPLTKAPITTTLKPSTKTSNRPTTMTTTAKKLTITTTTSPRPIIKLTMRPQTIMTTTKPTVATSRPTAMPLKLTTSAFVQRTTSNQTTSATSTHLTNIQDIPTQPPTGMQGLLSLLDASFGSFFESEPTGPMDVEMVKQQQHQLQQQQLKQHQLQQQHQHQLQQQQLQLQNQQLESRIATKGGTIHAYQEDFDYDSGLTTEPLPRDVRQIYDYDSRLKQILAANYDDDDDDEIEEYEDSMDGGIKRYDKVMDYTEENKVSNSKYHNDENEEDDDDFEDAKDLDQEDVEKNIRVAPATKA